jgi:hypothetical protein
VGAAALKRKIDKERIASDGGYRHRTSQQRIRTNQQTSKLPGLPSIPGKVTQDMRHVGLQVWPLAQALPLRPPIWCRMQNV